MYLQRPLFLLNTYKICESQNYDQTVYIYIPVSSVFTELVASAVILSLLQNKAANSKKSYSSQETKCMNIHTEDHPSIKV